MDLKQIIGFAITLLTAFASKTATVLDDQALTLLKALQESPKLLDWVSALLSRNSGIPDTALATLHVDENDPELVAAFDASPAVKEWAELRRRETVPSGAEPLAIGGIVTLIKFLPTIITLIKAAKDAGLFVQQK